MSHAKVLAGVLFLSFALSASASVAQQPAPPSKGEQKIALTDITFLTGYRFHLSATSIETDDPRFDWDCYFGGDIDLVDYRYGRINFLADYEVMLGRELRSFDPNQGSYYLDLSASARKGSMEFTGIFHHVSRHLGDRDNTTSVSWNTVGLKASGVRTAGRTTVTYNARLSKVIQAAFVDYSWEMGGGAETQYRPSRRFGFLARADVKMIGTDRTIAGRAAQVGAQVEGAVRVYGTGAGVEAFAGWERRVDPHPLQRETLDWIVFGFRFISR